MAHKGPYTGVSTLSEMGSHWTVLRRGTAWPDLQFNRITKSSMLTMGRRGRCATGSSWKALQWVREVLKATWTRRVAVEVVRSGQAMVCSEDSWWDLPKD